MEHKNDYLDELVKDAQELNMGYNSKPKTEGTIMAEQNRAKSQVKVKVAVELRESDICLLKSWILEPTGGKYQDKFCEMIENMTVDELNRTLVYAAVNHVVAQYAMSKVSPSV